MITETKEIRRIRQDKEYNKMLREISYKDEGELFLKALNNSCIQRLVDRGVYQVS